jgi:putative heme-binding domain-containing protein
MPGELQKRPDLRWGDDRGRIYRIVPAGERPAQPAPRLSDVPMPRLIELLTHENAWWRDTAARLLLERGDASVKPALTALASSGSHAAARVQALWLLANLKLLDNELLIRALDDADARIRQQAVILAESRLADDARLRQRVIERAADADARVRFRVALAFGGLATDDAVGPLVEVALAKPADRWTRDAVATALPLHAGPVLAAVMQSKQLAPKPHEAAELVRELATVVGAQRDSGQVAKLVALIGDENGRASINIRERALLGLATGLERRGSELASFIAQLSDGKPLADKLAAVFACAADDAADEQLDESARALKLDLLRHDRSRRGWELLIATIANSASQTLRTRAAEALAAHSDPAIGPALIRVYPAQTPAVRRAILDALLARADRAGLLLDELEAGRISTREIDATRANRLTNHAEAAVREKAKTLFSASPTRERQAVLDDYQPCLQLAADPLAGKELFGKHCATCHRVAGTGVDVAPDISDSRVKTPEQLLVDILNPNQAIDNNYVSYTVVTLDGNVHTGIIASETASSITLRQPENKSLELLRTDVESLGTGGLSLMPEGFEKELSKQQTADLVSFLKNWRYLDQPVPAASSEAR